MHPPTRYVSTTDGVRIAYAVHGEGPLLVFVRGWISHLDAMWDDPEFRPFMEALGTAFTVVRYDLRGCGLSDRDPTGISLDHLVLDLEAVIERVTPPGGDHPIVLYATCYGGPIAVHYAARHAERIDKLILDGTYVRGHDLATPQMRESVLGMIRMLETQPRAAHAMLDFFTNPDGGDLREQRLERTRRAIDADAASRLYELAFDLDITDDLRSLLMPALVLHRKRTQAVPFVHGQHVAALLRDATFVGVEGSAHNPWEGDATRPLAAMARFLGQDFDRHYRPRTSARPTVILFTDMVDSTATTARMGDDLAQDLVRAHNTIVRSALEARGGRVVKSTGDGVMAEFASVSSAVACAIDIQQRLAERDVAGVEAPPILVRIGINAGEPLSEGDDLHGLVVSTASRICDRAGAGEILVSNVVRELATGKGFHFADAGAHELKGIEGPAQLYRVDH